MTANRNCLDKFNELILNLPADCSDVHITADRNCFFRVDGLLMPLIPIVIFTTKELHQFLRYLLNDRENIAWHKNNTVDIAHTVSKKRLRINIYQQNQHIALAVRLINNHVRSLESEEYPPILKNFIRNNNGLILITGPSGSGKSSTLSAMLAYRAEQTPCHIITLEDPIEYLFTSAKSLIHQREYGTDFTEFELALKSAMRQDPDIIFIGEIRDQQTMQAAFSAAQTGHLVLSTLHTSNVVESLIRIEGLFPTQLQTIVRLELSLILRGIIAQQLLPMSNGGRICAMEILTTTDAVRHLIAAGQFQQIKSIVQTSKKAGMQTMEMSITELQRKKLIT